MSWISVISFFSLEFLLWVIVVSSFFLRNLSLACLFSWSLTIKLDSIVGFFSIFILSIIMSLLRRLLLNRRHASRLVFINKQWLAYFLLMIFIISWILFIHLLRTIFRLIWVKVITWIVTWILHRRFKSHTMRELMVLWLLFLSLIHYCRFPHKLIYGYISTSHSLSFKLLFLANDMIYDFRIKCIPNRHLIESVLDVISLDLTFN